MKITVKIIVASLLLSTLPAVASTPARIEAGNYTLDPSHSKVGFEVGHLVIASVEGRFDQLSGTISMGKKIEDTRIEAKVDVKSVSTGNLDRDKHLLSPDFFDSVKFPEMIFVSKKISGKPEALKVSGDLTLHGVTKPVELQGKYLGNVLDMYGNTKVAFVAKGKINRKDFGLTWSKAVEAGPVVGDEVSIDLKVEGGKPAAKN